jgi:oxygen-independent coproporphyrinogen-3 oxidase
MTSIDPARLNRSVPRYTSYPTVPNFHVGVGASEYRRWLMQPDPAQPLSIYLHIPFCRNSVGIAAAIPRLSPCEPVAAYAEALAREIDLIAGLMPGCFRVEHLHWGGGTPAILAPADFAGLIDRLRHHFDFTGDAEIAVELDPRGLDEARARALAAAGVTRVSLGVQDFDPQVQRPSIVGSPMMSPPGGGTSARRIKQVSFDLMYCLPLDDRRHARFGRARGWAGAAAPGAVRLCHVTWMKRHQRRLDERQLPGLLARQAQASAAAERLQARGYRWIGLDHFAWPDDALAQAASTGTLRRNFQIPARRCSASAARPSARCRKAMCRMPATCGAGGA